MLSCSCDWDGDGWWYIPPDDFTTPPEGNRKRCCSCGELINLQGPCLKFDRYRSPNDVIEERIWGDEVQIASKYMCEWCGEMYLNLEAIGYCHLLGDSLKEDMEDYWDLTGFIPIIAVSKQEKGD